MTLVCVRLDESYSTPRLTALADTRASIPTLNGGRKVVSDTTAKLFAIPVRCYAGNALTPVVGSWRDPYYETTIGLGYSGSCFEALTVIAHTAQRLSTLFAPNGDRPRPQRDGLINLIAKITGSYFAAHSGYGKPDLSMIIFGYEEGRPWVGTVSWDAKNKVRANVAWADHETLVTVGDGEAFEKDTKTLLKHIRRQKAKIREARKSIGKGAAADTTATLDIAERRAVEEEVLKRIESEFAQGIGGVMQRLELGLDGGVVVAGFTQDDRPYLDDANYSVAAGTLLGPVPIVQSMGRRARKAG